MARTIYLSLVTFSLIFASIIHGGMKESFAEMILDQAPRINEERTIVCEANYLATPHTLFFGLERDSKSQEKKYYVGKVGPGYHHFGIYLSENPLRKMIESSSLQEALTGLATLYHNQSKVQFYNFMSLSEAPAFVQPVETILSKIADTDAFLVIRSKATSFEAAIKYKNQSRFLTLIEASDPDLERAIQNLSEALAVMPNIKVLAALLNQKDTRNSFGVCPMCGNQ